MRGRVERRPSVERAGAGDSPAALPRLAWLEQPFDDDDRAADIAQQRIIRAGVVSWQLIKKGESFDAWKAVGKALEIGRTHALRVSGSNRPMGRPRLQRMDHKEWIWRHAEIHPERGHRTLGKYRGDRVLARDAGRQGATTPNPSVIECAPLAGGDEAAKQARPASGRRYGMAALCRLHGSVTAGSGAAAMA